jgi:hypothetical protein
MSVLILAASHKEYQLLGNEAHRPLMVGASLMQKIPDGWLRDDTGDNISAKNSTYCELTGLYWAWKSLPDEFAAEYIGLCHYRRYFGSPGKSGKIITAAVAETLLQKYDMILPKRRRYYIESNYSHYIHAHHEADLDLTRAIIAERYPDYLDAYDKRMSMTWGHRFNMFIMSRDLMNEYCSWLFDILFELENRLDISDYSPRDRRVFGFVSERLLDVWIDRTGYTFTEVPYIFAEKENIPLKAAGLIARKIKGTRRRGNK